MHDTAFSTASEKDLTFSVYNYFRANDADLNTGNYTSGHSPPYAQHVTNKETSISAPTHTTDHLMVTPVVLLLLH